MTANTASAPCLDWAIVRIAVYVLQLHTRVPKGPRRAAHESERSITWAG
jgi:hypothetical protein